MWSSTTAGTGTSCWARTWTASSSRRSTTGCWRTGPPAPPRHTEHPFRGPAGGGLLGAGRRPGWRALGLLCGLWLAAVEAQGRELAPDKAWRLLDELGSPRPETRQRAQERLIAAKDATLAGALVDLVFFSPVARPHAIAVLQAVLGEDHGRDYKAWIEAVGRREDLVPKPGSLRFKAGLYLQIDPAIAELLREEAPRTIRPEEIVWGGVKKDGIPALEHPPTVPAAEASYLQDDERVFGVSLGGEQRAYPHRILDWHEMANDTIGGRAVSLSYCTLCGSGILFETRLGPEETYTFGSSGLLYRSNKLMYDRQTNSLWSNLTGEPVLGPLVGRGKRLRVLPHVVTTWGEWRRRHPQTRVLSLATGHRRDYRPGAAYGKYFASRETMFPVWKKPAASRLEPKDWIWAVELDGVRKAYPLQELLRRPLLHDRVGAVPVLLLTDPQSEAVRVYRVGDRRLRAGEAGSLVDEAGEAFRVEEEALVSSSGEARLERVAGHRAYWFGWYAFFPGAELYEPGGP